MENKKLKASEEEKMFYQNYLLQWVKIQTAF